MDNYSCYHLLGLNEDATIQEIKAAYRRLALKYHPDKNISKKDVEKFKMITEAYHLLRADCTALKPKLTKTSTNAYGGGSRTIHRDDLAHETRKYEQVLWKYCAKISNNAALKIYHSVHARCNRVSSLLDTYVYKPFVKKGPQNLKSKLKL